jgi:hypothetical protein
MNSERVDVGAFPRPHSNDQAGNNEWAQDGMTLRDYFAAKAMLTIDPQNVGICDVPEGYARLADHCYRMADAMLAARIGATHER